MGANQLFLSLPLISPGSQLQELGCRHEKVRPESADKACLPGMHLGRLEPGYRSEVAIRPGDPCRSDREAAKSKRTKNAAGQKIETIETSYFYLFLSGLL
jgi:hypothetical protein